MSAAIRRKAEEQSLKALRELTALPHNKKCQECGQRGTTYADMNTSGFVCTQCSGFLRGLNPPHRVKSISMTTFSDKEVQQLKNGGNEVSRAIWLSRWTVKDREPNRDDESAFKEHLITKYERRQWYRSPEEAAREAEKKTSPKPEPKINPPPSTSRSPAHHHRSSHHVTTTQSTAAPSTSSSSLPTIAPIPSTSTSQTTAVGSLLDFDTDPFAPAPPTSTAPAVSQAAKTPAGGVSVLPPGPAPTLKQNARKSDEFGAFTGATLTPAGSQASSTQLTSSLPVPFASSASSVPIPGSASSEADKYAALASLDVSLRDFRVKDQPAPLGQTPPTSNAALPGGSTGPPANPFSVPASASNARVNPFLGSQSQPVTGSPQQQQQQLPNQMFGAQPGVGGAGFGAYQQLPQQGGGVPRPVGPGQQVYGGPPQPQVFGTFAQQPPQQVPGAGMVGVAVGGGFPQQWGQQQQQPMQQQQFVRGFGAGQIRYHQGGVQFGAVPQQSVYAVAPAGVAGVAAFGVGGGGGPVQYGGQPVGGGGVAMQYGGGGAVQFGVQPVGGGGVAPYPGAQPQGGQFARGAVQQQQPPQAFGGFVAATPPPQITNTSQQKPSNQFNWGPVPAPVGQHSSAGPASSGASATKSVFSSSSSSPQARSGWSQGMSKMTPPSTWGGATAAPVSAQGPSMWSSGLTGSQPPQPAQAGGGFGAFTSGQPVQPVQQAPPPGGSGPTANPFAASTHSSQTNPFL